ncbi:MAG: KpsF/GutQ family sugar-phosphate isomerase [Sutterellaceae bacterium]|nr:KpsF/GutQ family sugar-phosphate isomerase [Burkholderiaceae bacterium]MCX7901847.1 KpsF/GutQ family sugar-phosphate isomerase [Burkholderiaceae bacterium]MDW8430249.1 KpsF/GutQ family sugar-phosphate isomerase [Sutterellaceae bacterium]
MSAVALHSSSSALALAREVLRIEAEAVAALVDRIGSDFQRAVDLLLASRGRVVVSGVGKSGHIARKIAATLASTGTPALFVHAAEAAHGDLGMVTPQDVVIALSYSGETAELLTIVPILKREGTPLIALTGNAHSSLARHADVHLDVHVEKEACPLNLAPTSSTTAMLALGDALAIACLDARGFGPQDFARTHPGGALGRRLLLRVADIMRTGEAVPRVGLQASVMDAVREMTAKRIGMTAIVDDDGRVAGIFTEGDLRRLIERVGDVRPLAVADVMTRSPLTIGPQALAAEAARLLDQTLRNQLLVVEDGRLVGALHMHDLAAAKLL